MSYKTEEIKKGIKVHYITTNKFKTNLLAIFITTPLSKKTVTAEALIPIVLKRGTQNKKTQEEINIELENMYGATFDCGVDKIGDNHVLKFYIEAVNDNFIIDKEDLLEKTISLIFDIVLNPLTENNAFKKEYVEQEKENLKNIINSKIDNKDTYALNRCIEKMYSNKSYGLYKYGYVEDLDNINETNLYETYTKILKDAKIDIFVSGDFEEQIALKNIKNNIEKLDDREVKYIINNEETEIKDKVEINNIEENMDVTQGKLVIGLDINYNKIDSKYIVSLYNVILGEGATSKLFQNVREKASLAYSARSNYIRQKNNIFIRCGIEIQNYKKALQIIKVQLQDMKDGKFTDEDVETAKKYIISGIKGIEDEQDLEITYYLGQELSGTLKTVEQYMKKINEVTKTQIQKIAKNININTIYFLKNKI